MRTISISADLTHMLHEYLERVILKEIPTEEEIKSYRDNPESVGEERKQVIEEYWLQKLINVAIEQKESLLLWHDFEILLEDTSNRHRLEDYYAFQLVDSLSGIVERAQSLTARLVKQRPSAAVVSHLREAFRCYVYGHYIDCLCVCRCVLEESLKERLKDYPIPLGLYRRLDGTKKGEIEALIDHAFERKILDGRGVDLAWRVARRGNSAIHAGKASKDTSEKVLLNLQKLISDYLTK